MKSSLNLFKKSPNKAGKKLIGFLLVFVIFSSVLTSSVYQANAQLVTVDPANLSATLGQTLKDSAKNIWEKLGAIAKFAWEKAGSIALQQTVRSAVSKIAYDTANWLGSGGKGQKPLFITQDWGQYLGQVVDEAGGELIESFAANLSSSLNSDSLNTSCQNEYTECAKKCMPDFGTCTRDLSRKMTECSAEFKACPGLCKTAFNECQKNGGTASSTSPTATSSAFFAVSNNTGSASPVTNLCQPSSIEASLKISLGLVEQNRPGAPNCTATKMVQNWGDEFERLKDFNDPYFSSKITGLFNPVSNDLGIAFSVSSDMIDKKIEVNQNSKLLLEANNGWKQKVTAAKTLIGVPEDTQKKRDAAGNLQTATFGEVTKDIVVDAASVFLNQIAITGFNTIMSNLGKKSDESSSALTNPNADPNVLYGQKEIEQATAFIIKPTFGTESDFDILNSLASCPVSNNSNNSEPGPTNCVIDSQFRQGISEKRTVAEAIKEAYINGGWSLTLDTEENAYSLRNISILRKYRILPIGWEEAVNRAYASSTAIKKFTVNDLVSCFDQSDSHNKYSQEFNVRDQAWCRGLVDPNWVLKAPLNSCSKSGVGSQLISELPLENIYSVSRAEDYCADEKTCIKEMADGTCDAYGYCNEEKRTWNFSSDSCEPIDNTCNTFKNTNNGRQFSYLENTLDYSNCNSDTAGCRQYSVFGAYATTTGTVSWDAGKSVFFNKNVTTCSSKDESCTELIRIKPTWGANLVMNANFNNDEINDTSTGVNKLNDWPLYYSDNTNINSRIATVVDLISELAETGTALKLEANTSSVSPVTAGVYSSPENSLLPNNFELKSGESYTFSADVYVVVGQANVYLGEDNKVLKQSSTTGSWEHLSVTRTASDSFNKPLFGVLISSHTGGVKAYVKNLKFEVSNFENDNSIYGAYRFYQKIIPPYLEKVCYVGANGSDYSLRSDAPEICSNFARKCNSDELGCESFTNKKSQLNVSAQFTSADLCPGECVGYDMYISKANFFAPAQAENIIPSKTNACSAEAVGCSEFTNLDELSQGGETKEYYSSLKHCIKPIQSLCSSFYSWEGTASGYQLRLYSLQKATTTDTTGEPMEYGPVDSSVCNAEIYNKPTSDPSYNPDCREFYNAAGKVSYHLMSRTITCSDNCHAYRMSGENPLEMCLNGGTWNNDMKACIYQAIPGEGKTCSAEENGCREYNGNDGNNLQILSAYDFETGAQGWNSNCPGGLGLSQISNNKDGHSIYYKNTVNGACTSIGEEIEGSIVKNRLINQVFASDNIAAQLSVGNAVTQDKSYTLRFLAKSDSGNTNLQVYLYNNDKASPEKAYFTAEPLVVKGGGEWGIYQVNLVNLDHVVTPDEVLIITADKSFYFDEVVLTEITDRYYLIKGSSKVEDGCYYDMEGNYQGADYNLGCAAYSDRDNNNHNLRKFSKLCSNSSVGCEQMIDTKNYSPYGANIWGDENNNGSCDGGETDCVSTPKDSIIYAIYDETKKCNPVDKGCSRLGQAVSGATDWSDVFKKNNPDLYDRNLCGQAELNCEEWVLSDGSKSYFKDPGNEVCQYRESHDENAIGKSWYKIPVKRCDADESGSINGSEITARICSSNNDCTGKPCIIDNNDYICSTSNLKTFGIGGANNAVLQPDKQAGLCNASAAACTEYIDPVSKFSPNLVNNPNHEVTNGSAESWSNGEQVISLEKNKLYIFSASSSSANLTKLNFDYDIRVLSNSNNLGGPVRILSLAKNDNSIIFASLENTSAKLSGGEVGKVIEIKESVINYQIKNNIDTKSCNGSINFDSGCVLFNERSINGSSGINNLDSKWNASASYTKKTSVNCDKTIAGSCTANQLVKVRPNRTCAKWLDCISYIKDPLTKEKICYAVGECTRLNDDKECVSFEEQSDINIKFSNNGLNQNATGYYLLNKYHISNMKEVGINSNAHYDFEDSIPTLSCIRTNGEKCEFKENIAVDLLQRGPKNPPVAYPAHGESYLKVPSSYLVSPQSANSWVTVIPNKQYFINFLVNTNTSNSGAKVKLTTKNDAGTEYSIEKNFYSNDGWTRQIFSFNPGVATKIRIDLGATITTGDSYVYFDDINIEPVLEVGTDQNGNKQYVSRECRLYPTSESLTCVNKNNNVLKNGLEGYCLVHDQNNTEVCLMWYPVDKISAAQIYRNSSGYNGKFPLNYCTEVNGNFELVDYRKPYTLDTLVKGQGGNYLCGNENWSGYYTTDNNACKNNEDYPAPVCAYGYSPYVQSYNYNTKELNDDRNLSFIVCVPSLGTPLEIFVENKVDDKITLSYTGAKSVTQTKDISFSGKSGWYRYAGETPLFNVENNPVRVLDYDNIPATGEGLKYISGNDSEKTFRLTCKNFIQLVDNNGENQAWAKRTGKNSDYPISTPPYFTNAVNQDRKIEAYGQNRQDTPFGAALWPDDFNLLSSGEAVKLRNQYSTRNKEDILAGRPYGCSNYLATDKGTGCSSIGYCSLDPNVYCLNAAPTRAVVQLSVDDQHEAYFNGSMIGSNKIDLDNYNVNLIEREKNVLAIKAIDTGGEWGIAAAIDGIMNTNQLSGWKCSPTYSSDWNTTAFDDSSWSSAVVSKNSCSHPCESNMSAYKQIWDASSNTKEKSTVYCRYSFMNLDPLVSKKTCAEGGLGTCVPIWNKYLGTNDQFSEDRGTGDYEALLSTIFRSSYNSYSYVKSSEAYAPGKLQFSPVQSLCQNNVREVNGACSIAPTIKNIKFNGGKLGVSVDIKKKGVYNLSFTTHIDPEQQPLKQIHINWGDGTEQLITGQDSHSDIANPHLFYHYYSKIGQNIISIDIKDNWGIPSQY